MTQSHFKKLSSGQCSLEGNHNNKLIRVSDYKSMDISKKIYYSASFLAHKMAAIVHTGKKWAEPSVRLV